MATADRLTADSAPRYYPVARRLAKRQALRAAQVDDLVQHGMVRLLTNISRVKAGERAEPEDEEAWAVHILKRAMSDYAGRSPERNPGCRRARYRSHRSLDAAREASAAAGTKRALLAAPELVVDGWREFHERTLTRAFLAELEAVVGPKAAQMVRELMEPSEEAVAVAYRELREKERRAAAGKAVRGHRTLRVTHRHLREALDMSGAEWYEKLREIRRVARRYFDQESPP